MSRTRLPRALACLVGSACLVVSATARGQTPARTSDTTARPSPLIPRGEIEAMADRPLPGGRATFKPGAGLLLSTADERFSLKISLWAQLRLTVDHARAYGRARVALARARAPRRMNPRTARSRARAVAAPARPRYAGRVRLHLVLAVTSALLGACTQRPFASREAICRDYCERFTDPQCGPDEPSMLDSCVERCVRPSASYPCADIHHALQRCVSALPCEAFREALHDRRGPCGAEARTQQECDRRLDGPK